MLVGSAGGGMAGTPDGADLERLLAERGTQLMRVAIALTGDRQSGEDLLQAALERVLRRPRAVESGPTFAFTEVRPAR
jgi:DNA-directed RNA polymerase specialized sigma24 family protein